MFEFRLIKADGGMAFALIVGMKRNTAAGMVDRLTIP
jgi:hypothetical protein